MTKITGLVHNDVVKQKSPSLVDEGLLKLIFYTQPNLMLQHQQQFLKFRW